jgi:hypothetical protein
VGVRWNQNDLERFEANSGRGIAPEALKQINAGMFERIGRTKYGAHATVRDGKRFDSKLEADRYAELVLMEKANVILFFKRQPTFELQGGVRYRADFEVHYPIGIIGVHIPAKGQGGLVLPQGKMAVYIEYEDCKGYETQAGRNKVKQVEAAYGVKIVILKRPPRTKR